MFKIFLGVLLFQFGALILPGPDFAAVFRHSIVRGKREGLFCVAGVSAGVMIWLLITFFIGTALYTKYNLLYLCLIFIGIIYLYKVSIPLIYNFFNPTVIPNNDKDNKHSSNTHPLNTKIPGNSFFNGLFTNLSNVKAMVFFSTLLPLVNQLNLPFLLSTWLGMGAMTYTWFAFIAIMFGNHKIRDAFLSKIKVIELIIGSAIFFFASAILYECIVKTMFLKLHLL